MTEVVKEIVQSPFIRVMEDRVFFVTGMCEDSGIRHRPAANEYFHSPGNGVLSGRYD